MGRTGVRYVGCISPLRRHCVRYLCERGIVEFGVAAVMAVPLIYISMNVCSLEYSAISQHRVKWDISKERRLPAAELNWLCVGLVVPYASAREKQACQRATCSTYLGKNPIETEVAAELLIHSCSSSADACCLPA